MPYIRVPDGPPSNLAWNPVTDGDTHAQALAIGSDLLGAQLRSVIADHVATLGYEVADFGCAPDEDIDYPDVAVEVARAVAAGDFESAILVCGTGIGMAITANKVRGIRAASVADVYSAARARESNDAQILCLGSRVVGPGLAIELVNRWLGAEFAGGRSTRKVAKIDALDELRGARS